MFCIQLLLDPDLLIGGGIEYTEAVGLSGIILLNNIVDYGDLYTLCMHMTMLCCIYPLPPVY